MLKKFCTSVAFDLFINLFTKPNLKDVLWIISGVNIPLSCRFFVICSNSFLFEAATSKPCSVDLYIDLSTFKRLNRRSFIAIFPLTKENVPACVSDNHLSFSSSAIGCLMFSGIKALVSLSNAAPNGVPFLTSLFSSGITSYINPKFSGLFWAYSCNLKLYFVKAPLCALRSISSANSSLSCFSWVSSSFAITFGSFNASWISSYAASSAMVSTKSFLLAVSYTHLRAHET